ncbi:MAG: class I SAM-dependent RNA methyltransferase [Nitrospirae bacterium]|nr:class I SAM-dependent RNA methyltransferase [Nitrospirota bacterium]
MERTKIIITCAKGIAPFLKEEILKLGFSVVSETVTSVMTEGNIEDAMKLNLWLRTGHRVLFLIREFFSEDPDELYDKLIEIPWENYISEDGYFCVTSSVDNPTIKDSRYANVKCKDAIVDRIRLKKGKRPDSGPERNSTVVNLYWKDKYCSVYLDTSGEALSRRNYRKIPFKAPMQETLASAVIMATKWDGKSHFVNPMCGSGTLAIEAALMGINKPPGILRSNYSFMHLKGFKSNYWNQLRIDAKKNTMKKLNCKIIASDISEEAVSAAIKNAKTAGVEQLIEFLVCDYSETEIPEGEGVVILNPEYGERMGKVKELETVYKGIGDFFKQKCTGYKGYIFTGNLDLAKKVGLKTFCKIPFYNGDIECRLLGYELYKGSKKKQKELLFYT